MIFLLLGVLALVIGGCVCVVWAERGGPPWVRGVAFVTRTAGELLSSAQKSRRRRSSWGSSSDD
ncbi:hypothetical protein GCM10018980_25910 [Streptomyces capoamus]|uniref:Uncharacterized protein n=2 Tax=Streptomyces capoamus TaxID=68183 RepID=A0A919C597_9ACTN|nr:hypothetical protein [Streptomyces capoamus]GGW19912.1 hypothetical protein GCM10010501_60680 [Streptomyces libani subsp. rufus]GHG46737.1 hypothetical protein GCM10018980_25910 [Streptomyces capoamus]